MTKNIVVLLAASQSAWIFFYDENVARPPPCAQANSQIFLFRQPCLVRRMQEQNAIILLLNGVSGAFLLKEVHLFKNAYFSTDFYFQCILIYDAYILEGDIMHNFLFLDDPAMLHTHIYIFLDVCLIKLHFQKKCVNKFGWK